MLPTDASTATPATRTPSSSGARWARPTWLAALIAAWLTAVGGGSLALLDYGLAPEALPTGTSRWPDDSGLERTSEFTMVLSVHPRCPCTRATIAELARLMADIRDRVRVHVLFLRPSDTEPSFVQTDLWSAAELIPGVELHVDAGGRLAKAFGTQTSGTALLYGPSGQLAFAGGITSSRGHEGASVGQRRIREIVARGESDRALADVFGCSLFAEATP